MIQLRKMTTLALAVALALAACRGREVLPQGGNPIPTPRTGQSVGVAPESQAAASPDETFKRYIRDSIAATVAVQKTKIDMRGRYQSPDLTLQDLGGLVSDIAVLEDRTKITTPKDTVANAHADLDIRVTFADGDSETRRCQYEVNMQRGQNQNGEDVWYVVNPDAFPVFVSCVKS